MRMMAGIVLAALAGPAAAATCPAAAPFAGWEVATPVAATGATIAVGRTGTVALVPVAGLRFAVPPGKAAAADSGGAIVAFTVATAGRYRVGAGGGVWIDVIEGGRALPSVAHGHGPDCGPVRKIVDFDLTPGIHTLQLSGGKAKDVAVMIAPAAG